MTLPDRYVPSWPVPGLVTPANADARDEAWFVRSGDIWAIGYAGDAVHLHDSKGLRYLALLLAAPGREILALELASPAWSEWPAPTDRTIPLHGRLDIADPVIDAQARGAYEARISELQQLIDEAERDADFERAARDRSELDAIARHLVTELGLGGRVRASTSPSERARQSVTKAVRSALHRIAEEHQRLSDHLERTVRTGRYCVYDPEPALQPTWLVRH